MNKKSIRLFSVLSVSLLLAGCSTTSTTSIARDNYLAPNAIHLNRYSISLFKGEKEKIDVSFTPCQAAGSKVTYTSSDNKVASVDAKGQVTAKGAGEATITVSTIGADGKAISKDVDIIVTNKASLDQAAKLAKKQLSMQTAAGEVHTYSEKGVHHSFTLEEREDEQVKIRGYVDDCITTVSRSQGYLSIDGYQTDFKTEGGSPDPQKYVWTFYCDSNYDSWLFHETDSVKHYTSIPTQAYIGQDRIQPVYDIANSLFGNLVDIADGGFEDVTETDALQDVADYVESYTNFGVAGENILRFNYGGNLRGTIAPDEEDNLNIPAGTRYGGYIEYTYTFVNGFVKDQVMHQVLTYTNKFDGKDYIWDVMRYDEYLVNNEVELKYPNVSDYGRVDQAFDL